MKKHIENYKQEKHKENQTEQELLKRIQELKQKMLDEYKNREKKK